jgi:hypothetical protein
VAKAADGLNCISPAEAKVAQAPTAAHGARLEAVDGERCHGPCGVCGTLCDRHFCRFRKLNLVAILQMGCHHGTRFRRDVAARCDAWSAPQCQEAVQRAAARYGPQCLRVRLYGTLESPPIAAYACPRASAGLRALCQDVAPAAVGPAVRPGPAPAAVGPAVRPGPAGAAGPGAGTALGAAAFVGGVFAVDRALMNRRVPYTHSVSGSLEEPLLSTNPGSLSVEGRPAGVNASWAPPQTREPKTRREAVDHAFTRAKHAIEHARRPAGRRDSMQSGPLSFRTQP